MHSMFLPQAEGEESRVTPQLFSPDSGLHAFPVRNKINPVQA